MSKRKMRTIILMILGVLAWGYSQYQTSRTPAQSPSPQPLIVDHATQALPAASPSSTHIATNALVVRVIDGDTIEARIDGGNEIEKIRLLGINTPESVDPRRPVQCFGKEASKFAKQLMEGKRITLKEDVQADDRDKYGRLLRNILLEDGTDVNALLIKEGYAYAYVSFPLNKDRKAEMRRLEQEARTAKRGLWSPETCDGMK
jgi:micrococcal nuclease